ncbi:CTRL-like protein [Mya arenaria]|uniref:CTRL-like protein n=1 Tax=Mya arenaria TaxID=6604 RepID=A0ABY7F0S6_MYAAR|nr:CTRL-like protein [Mya arenaria]WAR15182.1 CTRL-like protein [Mya arenaria]
MVLFWNKKKKISTCLFKQKTSGDSGGPMVCYRGSTPVLAGVTSWGASGCGTNYPSVYARVSNYKEWLDQEMTAL